ncbi:MAG: lysophospholipid acyltransferase family protein [Pseudomonadota bacterium]
MDMKYGLRLARVTLHMLQGLFTCALIFPWLQPAGRNVRIQRWSRRLLRLCGVHVEVVGGVEALGHAMVVANHISWLDIFVINALYPSRFVAKAEIREWPVLGKLVELAGTVFIARGSRRDLRAIFKGLVASLHLGERVAFFPEGTTAQQGQLLPFHANLFEAAIDAKVPVQPFAIKYVCVHGLPHPSVDYVGEMTFVQSFKTVLRSSVIRAQLTCLPALPAEGAHRRELAQASQDAIAAALAD